MTRETRTLKLPRTRKARLRVARAGLHEEAATRLRALIVTGELQPGLQLTEADLSEALGVSRTPLREALKLLATEGLVELRLNRGAVVAPLRPEELADLFEAVACIERSAAELAARRMTRRDLQRLRTLQDRMERHYEAGELENYFQLNQQIHAFIVAGAKNNALKSTHEALLSRAERARFFALSSPARWDESVEEHRLLLKALEERDSEMAGKILAHHVTRTGDVVRDVLQTQAGAADESDINHAVGA
ncbi:GntR family transcriptional regulator [Ensifer sp. LC163]|uniref:GntR family transcriptional regulator n=1 Tax=Ensifer sp. LC163 TaxID=1120652 RepID=UPI0009F33F54|nr:GntR family transcriptional regulator [Ensifer sp. LC163]